MTCWASWLRPTPPARVRPRSAGAPRSRWGVRAEAHLRRSRLSCCPPRRPPVLPAGRHHAGAHLPSARLVPLAFLEGGDGADARGAAVLGQDYLRQCHCGECRPPAAAPKPAGRPGARPKARVGSPLSAVGRGRRGATPRLSPPRGSGLGFPSCGCPLSAAEGLIPCSQLQGAVSSSRPGLGKGEIGLATFLKHLGDWGFLRICSVRAAEGLTPARHFSEGWDLARLSVLRASLQQPLGTESPVVRKAGDHCGCFLNFVGGWSPVIQL